MVARISGRVVGRNVDSRKSSSGKCPEELPFGKVTGWDLSMKKFQSGKQVFHKEPYEKPFFSK